MMLSSMILKSPSGLTRFNIRLYLSRTQESDIFIQLLRVQEKSRSRLGANLETVIGLPIGSGINGNVPTFPRCSFSQSRFGDFGK